VPSLFVYEVFAVASRTLGDDDLSELWSRLLSWRLRVRDVDAALVPEALHIRGELGCSLYDAFSPAVALQADAVLYSADAKAHGQWPDVVLLG
jgi:predicted nucleic acid-binding protein